MKQGWEIKKLGEVCYFERGLTYAKGDEVVTSSKGVLRSNNIDLITNSLNYDEIKYLREDFEIPTKKMVRKNSLLMCISNGSKIHLGKVALIEDDIDYAFGGFMGLLTPNEAIIHPRYFYYALISPAYKMMIQGLSDGANINNLKFADLQSFDIPIPPLAEQERIVEMLDREFEKIDALKANAERNLQHAKDLFKSNLKCIFSGNNKALGDVLNLRRGYDLTHSEMIEGDIPVAGSGGIIGYHNVATNITPCITVGRSGSVGKIHIYNTCWAHNTVLYIDDFKGNSPYYLYYLLISLDLSKKGSGCGVPTLNRNYLHPIIIGFSENVSEQEQIVSLLDKLSEHCKALEENYTKTMALCDDMKQALLRQAFNGEL